MECDKYKHALAGFVGGLLFAIVIFGLGFYFKVSQI